MSNQLCCDRFKTAIDIRVITASYARWGIVQGSHMISIKHCPWCGTVLNPPVFIDVPEKRKPKLKLVKK